MPSTIPPEVNELLALREDRIAVIERFESKPVGELLRLLPYFWSTGTTGAELQAFREAGQSVIDHKLTETLVTAINGLNASTARLTKVGWVLSGVISLASILVPIYLKH